MHLQVGREHERVVAFDRMIGAIDGVLRNPEIIAALGSTAKPLQGMMDQLYLPDMSDAGPNIPASLRDTNESIAFIPIDDAEINRAQEFADQLFAQTMGEAVQLPLVVPSVAYGYSINTGSGLALAIKWEAMLRERDTKLGGPLQFARASVDAGFIADAERLTYRQSAPVIIMRESLMQNGDLTQVASTGVHELTHVDDLRANGFLFYTPYGAASTEVHAYEAGGVVLEAIGDPYHLSDSNHQDVRAVRERYGDPASPYTITGEEMFDSLWNLQIF
ncbi:MAG TPA: hypothetical protein VJP80_04630 [Candidatus Saccharimonadales bacterium]|nr:hypothetical protein [Candidatus Saccharimonadales bacterium]